MKNKNILVLLVSILAIVIASQGVRADRFGNIAHVEVNGISADSGTIDFAAFAGQRVPVLVQFNATDDAQDVKLVAWISGDRRNSVESERFDVLANRTYTQVVYLTMPENLDELHEPRSLEISVESEDLGQTDSRSIDLTVQRESYVIELLSVNMPTEVKAGESLFMDIVLKNRGSHFAEDNFLTVTIPELQLVAKSYFGDLSPVDQGGNLPEKEDAVERRAFLRVPSNVPSGLYTVKFEAFNGDSVASTEKKVFINGIEKESRVFPSITSKTLAISEEGEYSLTLINKGNNIQIYNLVVNAPKGLEVEVSDPVAVVPAGTSKKVTVVAKSDTEGEYQFSVKVLAEDGSLVSENNFKANVEGKAKTTTGITTTNATVLLTVILAIVFVVLLVVLIVLLTRKPEKSEEFGESYY